MQEMNIADATDQIFQTFDSLLNKGKFAECDSILASVDVSKLKSPLIRSFLTITMPAKEHLPFRVKFFNEALIEVAKQRGKETAHKLLHRLE